MNTARHDPLPADIADRLLELLSSDDAFRASFQENPVAALASLGYKPADQELAADPAPPKQGAPFYCMTSQQLASKEEIAKARKELVSHLTVGGNHHVIFAFEAGKVASTVSLK
ncbi:NHLP-related RiPP peptide [Xanthomonas translucens]|uniref:Uncharacterized protein n=1 Tax=Xanthomonas translucens pv. translucens DSM 18974 TaxID=1261556 RepID=A0A1C3TIK5_XANCT|nr:NHLP-related RiPP peptide [Xanthomonas translucens]MCC8446540.1 NHLP-related RiPP peptide [Xanthomonas translucens pv. translucens]CCP41713.1 hypothetical protein BN444_03439 [Xanthomonas translucens pv. translucens DSM 18974]SCB03077.1 hypothetical protein BN444_03439 [Xanthomonas translucens pv. translucens DSM 18974]